MRPPHEIGVHGGDEGVDALEDDPPEAPLLPRPSPQLRHDVEEAGEVELGGDLLGGSQRRRREGRDDEAGERGPRRRALQGGLPGTALGRVVRWPLPLALHLDVDLETCLGTDVERLLQRGHPGRQVSPPAEGHGTRPGSRPWHVAVVEHDERPVRRPADVQLDAVGIERRCQGEGVEGVLAGGLGGRPSVGIDGGGGQVFFCQFIA